MIVRYDALNRFEQPSLTLCNPGSEYNGGVLTRTVGILTDVSDVEIVFNFNATSELNFRITRVRRESAEENAHVLSMYKAVQNRRLIFIDTIGYFMIVNVTDGFDGTKQYKDVRAQSIDIEIAQKMTPYIADGTYRFSSDDERGVKGLFETIVETLPLWTIGTVDASVASKYRTFEDIDTSLNCLGFFLDNMQDAYECIILFDITARTINVYGQDNYVQQTDVHITKNDLISELEMREDANDLYTALSVRGDDERVTIAAINPIGSNTIYNFNHYIDWMTPTLGSKVRIWQTAVADALNTYHDLNLGYYTKMNEVSNYQMELQRIDTQLTMYRRCRDNIVAESSTDIVDSYNRVIVETGGTSIVVYSEIADTLAEIDGLIATCDAERSSTTALLAAADEAALQYRAQINAVHAQFDMSTYFTATELEELNNYIFEGSYSDEYVTITDIMSYAKQFDQMKLLYDRAAERLAQVSQPTQEFDIDVENFVFVKDFAAFSEQLETGCLINVELDTDDVAQLFLATMTINYEDRALSMTFGNRFNKFDVKSLFDDMLGDISKSANALNYIKEVLYPIKNGELDIMREAIQTSRDLTMAGALASDNEEVVIDGSGYTGKKLMANGAYDPRQVKITGKTLVFTDDAWETCKVAIGELLLGDGNSEYGVNAQAIIGDLIMGNNLRIIDANGNDLLSVVDGKIQTQVDAVDGRLTAIEENADSINIRVQQLEASDGEVDHVTTTTGYTFNADGLNIYRAGDEMRNLLDNTGMYVTRSGEAVLTANNEGVSAINLRAKQYLIIGSNSRFEDYSNGTDTHRTACFYIGE